MKKTSVYKFSKDIEANAEEYYVSTAEMVAEYLAKRLSLFDSAADLCCMVGMTTVQLAKKIRKVYGIDIDCEKIKKAEVNARIYGVEDRTTFINGDVLDFKILKKIKADVAILDPSWRRPNDDRYVFVDSMENMRPNLKEAFKLTKKYITKNIVIRVPKNFSFEELRELGPCKIENMIWDNIVRYKFAYFFPEIKKNEEENIYFPKFIYSTKKKYHSLWNTKEHPDSSN